MSIIYLIRHGRTRANERHLYCGSTDIPLSPDGAAELRLLRYPPIQAQYLTSGMTRTNETLRILFGNVPYREAPEFREMDFGIFEMRGYDELKEDPAYLEWITGDNEKNVPPGGESGKEMVSRVLSAFDGLERAGKNTVLITHGGVIAAIMASRFPEEGKNRYQWQPAPGRGYRMEGKSYSIL